MTDLGDPGLYEKGIPHDLFTRLRRDDPVHWNPEKKGPGYWAILRHADIVEVSRNPAIFSSAHEHGGHRIFNENEVGLTGAGDAAVGIPFISRDPPIHTRYRKFVMPALAPGRLDGIEALIEQRAEALLAKVPIGQSVDIVPLLSAPLPLLTLAELLGVGADSWQQLYHWTNAFVGEDDPEFRTSPEAMAKIMGEFFEFSKSLFDARRAEPGPDIASLLANTEIDGEPVPFADFMANLILVLVGGNETTRNSISHSIINFARNPDQWDALRADPALMKTATAEMVRYATPVIHMRRTAIADTEIGGVAVARGDKVVMWYASGNRDEGVFNDPNRFDITRKGPTHIGFGAGQHVCVGSRLAEMQLRVVFSQLAQRVSAFEVEEKPRRFRSNFINGLKSLKTIMAA